MTDPTSLGTGGLPADLKNANGTENDSHRRPTDDFPPRGYCSLGFKLSGGYVEARWCKGSSEFID